MSKILTNTSVIVRPATDFPAMQVRLTWRSFSFQDCWSKII